FRSALSATFCPYTTLFRSVVGLGWPVVVQGQHFGHDGASERIVFGELGNDGLGLGFLLRCGEVDAAAVLRAHVVALAVECGGVRSEEHTSELQSRENIVCR